MQCIYFGSGEKCYANPPIPALAGIYKPEDEIKKKYCKASEFRGCPRYVALLAYLRACKGE